MSQSKITKLDPRAGNFLRDYLVNLSAIRMAKHCLPLNFESVNVETYEGKPIVEDEISLIMLWGESATIVLKTHYNLEVARKVASTAIGLQLAETSDEMVRAYMNEFNNLQGGFFRGILEEENLLIGMSLPFVARGSDELLYFNNRDDRYIYTKWILKSSDGHEFKCSSEILLHDSNGFLGAESHLITALDNDKKTDGGGDIEFF